MAKDPELINTSFSLYADQIECIKREMVIRRENSMSRLVRDAVTEYLLKQGYRQDEQGVFTGEKEK